MSARRFLILPLLSPLLAVLLVAALNPGPALSFRLLTWVTPRAPLGLWLGGAAVGGAALSGAGTALALRQGQAVGSRSRRRFSRQTSRPWTQGGFEGDGGWETSASSSRPPRREAAWSREMPPGSIPWQPAAVAVAPPRSPGEPPPTVDVPFRILHRPSQAGPAREPQPVAVGVDEDWGAEAGADDW